MADAVSHADAGELLLDIRNLKIEATVYPPGEDPRQVTIVDGVSLKLHKGKVLGLIGESGAGKSTIGLSSMGYGRGGVKITGGEVILNGRDILKGGMSGLRKLRGREVCYVAQSAAAAFNPSHRLMDQVVEAALRHGTATRKEAERLNAPFLGEVPLQSGLAASGDEGQPIVARDPDSPAAKAFVALARAVAKAVHADDRATGGLGAMAWTS